MINSEDDVRAYVRQASAGRARWVEPALGSTPGLPDCWVPMGDRQVHLELKCGEIKGGKLCFTVRPEQRREIKAMLKDGVTVGFCVGLAGTKSVLFMAATQESLAGKVVMNGEETPRMLVGGAVANNGGFWAGVNFIIYDFEIRSNLVDR